MIEVAAPDYSDRLGRAELDGITADVLVARVAALAPLVAARASAAEALRRPDHPIQRAARDISVATGHALHDRTTAMELHGRMLLGLQPQATLY